MCFCTAVPDIWRSIFKTNNISDIKETLITWYSSVNDYVISGPYSKGWATDQHKLYEYLQNTLHKIVLLKDLDTKFNRLDRIDIDIISKNLENIKKAVKNQEHTDFHLPRPFKNYSNLIHNIIGIKKNYYNNNIGLQDKLKFISSKIDNIYIIHYTKLLDRKQSMIEQLKIFENFININWVDNYDREVISQDIINENYLFDSTILFRYMSLPEFANFLAHKSVLEKIKVNDNIALILEDDTIFKKDFIQHLYHTLKNLEDDWEMVCLGGITYQDVFPGKTLENSLKPEFDSEEIILHEPENPGVHTMSCILTNKKAVNKILNTRFFKKISAPIDHAILLANIEENIKMYWCQPWLSFEGSKKDLFTPSLSMNF